MSDAACNCGFEQKTWHEYVKTIFLLILPTSSVSDVSVWDDEVPKGLWHISACWFRICRAAFRFLHGIHWDTLKIIWSLAIDVRSIICSSHALMGWLSENSTCNDQIECNSIISFAKKRHWSLQVILHGENQTNWKIASLRWFLRDSAVMNFRDKY